MRFQTKQQTKNKNIYCFDYHIFSYIYVANKIHVVVKTTNMVSEVRKSKF
jgi:hypothetical protein